MLNVADSPNLPFLFDVEMDSKSKRARNVLKHENIDKIIVFLRICLVLLFYVG